MKKDKDQDSHPSISTRPIFEIMTEWTSKKNIGDVFAKETRSLSMRESERRFYFYRPNNYSIKIPIKSKFSLPLKDSGKFKKVDVKNWTKYILKKYHGYTAELTPKSLLLYMTTRTERMISSKEDIDKITNVIIEDFLKTAKRFQREFKVKLKLHEWKWHRKEIGLKDDKLQQIDPKILIHDDVFKKVYDKETEFYDEVYVKNYISNRALEELSPFIAQELNDIRTILLGFQKENLALSNAVLLIAQTLKKLEEREA